MSGQVLQLRDLYAGFLADFYQRYSAELMQQVHAAIEEDAAEIADGFYRSMLETPGSGDFLTMEVVSERLHASMTQWVRSLFVARQRSDLEVFVDQQIEIGRVHARIDLPIHLFAHGIRAIKRGLFESLLGRVQNKPLETTQQVHEILDIVTALITESYLIYLTSTERQTQALKMDVVGRHLVVECERMRASLLDWLRHALTDFHQHTDVVPSVRESEFGLWAMHKAGMLLEDNADVQDLCNEVNFIDQATQALFASQNNEQQAVALQQLNAVVTQTTWKLMSLSDQLHEVETGRDPLTSMFNRRYLEPILKREVRYSIRHHRPFALMLLDIDYFKRFNDQHGHAAGDEALRQVAIAIGETVRVSDVVFRYGGEEFMILLSEMNQQAALVVAEKLRSAIAAVSVSVEAGREERLTVSIGVAIHDGHPDYEKVIDRADKALYQAKDEGRNRVCSN